MRYIIKKIVALIMTLFVVSALSFLAFQMIPSDAAVVQLGNTATPEKIEALQKEMGLDRPPLERFGEWFTGLFSGDLGESFTYHMPVSDIILGKLPITITMICMSFIFLLLLSIPLSLLCARFEGGALDRTLVVLSQMVMSVPGFFIGILMVYGLGLLLKLFTPGAFVSFSEDAGAFLYYMIFPSLAVALPKSAMGTKILRSAILQESGKDYVRTAYSHGNSKNKVLVHHVMKNSLLPAVSFWALAIADVAASSVIMEQVFSIPGMGAMLVQAISNRDYVLVQGIILLIAAIIVVIHFVADLLYGILDPRIQLKKV